MTVFKRSFLRIKRNFAQNIMLFLIILLLGILSAGAISIGRAIERTEENVWRQLPALALIEYDWAEVDTYWTTHGIQPDVTARIEILEEFANLPYVNDMEISFFSQLNNRVLSRYWDPNVEVPDTSSLTFFDVHNMELFGIRGISHPEFLELSNEIIEISSGLTFTEEQIEFSAPVVIISEELARENNLTIGSIVTLEAIVTTGIHDFTVSWFDEDNVLDSLAIDFEVIGIYEFIASLNLDINEQVDRLELLNTFFMPYTVLVGIETFRNNAFGINDPVESGLSFSHYLLLRDARDLPALHEVAMEILPDFLMLTDVSDSFSDVMTSMEHVRSVSTVVLLLAVSGSVIILSLVITLLLRDRRHEIGIYLSLGEHKKKVILQFLFEIMLITGVAVSLSLFIGSFLSSGLSQNMLIQELSNMREGNVENTFFTDHREIIRFAPDPLSSEELIELFDTSMDSEQVLMFYGIAIITVMISTVVPMVYVLRLEPKEILL